MQKKSSKIDIKAQQNQRICVAVQLYKNGHTNLYLLAGAMKVHFVTIYRWRDTDLWKKEMGREITFREPHTRKNSPLFKHMKQRYHELENVAEHNKIGILTRDTECTVC